MVASKIPSMKTFSWTYEEGEPIHASCIGVHFVRLSNNGRPRIFIGRGRTQIDDWVWDTPRVFLGRSKILKWILKVGLEF